MCQFVPFFSYISNKYDMNWFTIGKVITKKGELFIETQCTEWAKK